MKDVIIPVDFSQSSLHAARYAADMFNGRQDIRVILYHMYEEDEDAETVANYLQTLRNEMTEKGIGHIECVTESGEDLVDSLERLAYQKTAELIVMGITEREDWSRLFKGSRSLKMAATKVCPVMIVPHDAVYSGMNNIALTSDFEDVENNTPVLAIKAVLELFKASLHIVNVDSAHYVTLTPEFLAEREKMLAMFNDFNPEFYFIGMNDFHEAIEQFSKDHKIDLIIIIPKNHSFFNSLFSSSNTKKLAYSSSVPLLAAHQ